MTGRVAVVGASGFVGSAVVDALRARGVDPVAVSAPRLVGTIGAPAPSAESVQVVAESLDGASCVINAAGAADALSVSTEVLDGANGLMPGLLARACLRNGARLVHVSSAAVQGALPLDSSQNYAPFSPYSRSKVIGEQAVLHSGAEVCVMRPPGVHAHDRAVTQSIARLATSPLSSVAAPGTDNSPQAQLANVADAVAFVACYPRSLPHIVHLPPEGISTASLLRSLSGHSPVLIPRALARIVVSCAKHVGARSDRFAGHARRLEVLWFGQTQEPSWLTSAGWAPPNGLDGWERSSILKDKEERR